MESWRAVLGWEGWYEVSDRGRVRSLPRESRAGKGVAFYRGKMLKAATAKSGYRVVTFTAPGGRREDKYVHRLVAEAFIGPCPKGKEVCHNDGSRHKNQIANLRYGTRSDNARDRIAHGRGPTGEHARGEKNAKAVLTEKDVKYIRAHPEKTLAALGEKFGVHLGTIHCVRAQKTWRHV
jgi:HNH endonuclease/NUMOD4 motif